MVLTLIFPGARYETSYREAKGSGALVRLSIKGSSSSLFSYFSFGSYLDSCGLTHALNQTTGSDFGVELIDCLLLGYLDIRS